MDHWFFFFFGIKEYLFSFQEHNDSIHCHFSRQTSQFSPQYNIFLYRRKHRQDELSFYYLFAKGDALLFAIVWQNISNAGLKIKKLFRICTEGLQYELNDSRFSLILKLKNYLHFCSKVISINDFWLKHKCF